MAVRGGSSDKTTPANEGAVGKGEGKAIDPSGATPDKRLVPSFSTVGGEEASGVIQGAKMVEDKEEEDEEIIDPKEKFEEECRESALCAPAKHQYNDCVNRVTAAAGLNDNGEPKEDCVEEFFHLTHCATNCAAAKLWTALK